MSGIEQIVGADASLVTFVTSSHRRRPVRRVRVSVEGRRPSAGTAHHETVFRDLECDAIFTFDGERWQKVELVKSLARLAKLHLKGAGSHGKYYIAVSLRGKHKKARYIGPNEIVHRVN